MSVIEKAKAFLNKDGAVARADLEKLLEGAQQREATAAEQMKAAYYARAEGVKDVTDKDCEKASQAYHEASRIARDLGLTLNEARKREEELRKEAAAREERERVQEWRDGTERVKQRGAAVEDQIVALHNVVMELVRAEEELYRRNPPILLIDRINRANTSIMPRVQWALRSLGALAMPPKHPPVPLGEVFPDAGQVDQSIAEEEHQKSTNR